MRTMLFRELTSASGKDEEVEALEQLVNFANEQQTYLAQILSYDLLEWFDRQVHSDSGCNIQQWLRETEGQLTRATGDNLKLQAENSQMAGESQRWVDHKERELQTVRDELLVHKQELERSRTDMYEEGRAHRDDVDRLAKSEDRLRVQLEQANDQVDHLKAKLYDAMMREQRAAGSED